ncbi:MAG: translocation/assembly module TamB domain-containing protein [Candidatus Eremiobacteraeota bacterium]|nr:translocation/assembly module TamB domain-containing protein [Candidatus Eremiobacteraeota bacterium]
MRTALNGKWFQRIAAIALCLLLAGAIAFAQRQALARAAITAAVASFAHVRVAFERTLVTTSGAELDGVRITSANGEPIGTVAHLALRYDLRDLLPGGSRWLGLESIAVDRPHLEIVRHADGTYNVPMLQLARSSSGGGTPMRFTATVRDGSIDLIDRGRVDPNQRHLRVAGIQVNADVATDADSRYTATMRYAQDVARWYPIRGTGDVDPSAGYAMQHWTAPELPIAGAVDYALHSPSLHLAAGTLRGLDARYFGFTNAAGTFESHLAASAQLAGARVAIGGLAKPVRDVEGRVDVYEGGLLVRNLRGTIAGTPAFVTGGIFGPQAPQFRMAVRGGGQLAQLRSAFAQAAHVPVSGQLSYALSIEGAISKPLVWIALRVPHGDYAGQPFDRAGGLIAFDGTSVHAVDVGTTIDGAEARVRGRASFGAASHDISMLVDAGAPMMGTYGNALAVVSGKDPRTLEARGIVFGASNGQRVDGTFDVAANGTGTIGPLLFAGDRGSLYARIVLDRPHGRSFGIVDAQHYPLSIAGSTIDARMVGVQTASGIALAGRANAQGRLNGRASLGAIAGNSLRSPSLAGTLLVQSGRIAGYPVAGALDVALRDGLIAIDDGAGQVGPAFVTAQGTVGRVAGATFEPALDLDATMRTADAHALLAMVQPRAAHAIVGSVDATVHVSGTQSAPAITGTIDAPEGSINGLAFRDLHAGVDAGGNAIALNGGHVVVGSTAIAFDADASSAAAGVDLDAPHADLADFNDYFDTGDTFAGTGRLAMNASLEGGRVIASSGSAAFTNARFRRIALGNVDARWRQSGSAIATNLALGGPSGLLRVDGSIAPASMAMNVRATARHFDLATWLPMAGMNAPITGKLDADAALAGTYPDIDGTIDASMPGGTAGPFTISRFALAATAQRGRGTIRTGVLEMPGLTTTLGGSFGLRPDDRFALVAHSTSPNVGSLLKTATGSSYDFSGSLDSTLRIAGTRAHPQAIDDFTLAGVRYRELNVSRVAGEVLADRSAVAVRNGEIDLQPGKLLFSGTYDRSQIAASMTANGVGLGNVGALFPKGTQLKGTIDGTIGARGRLTAPHFNGTLALTGGAFIGPQERAPIKDVTGTIALDGQRVTLNALRGFVGGGSVAANGWVAVPSLRDVRGMTFAMHVRADNAHLEMPAYFQGNVDAALALTRSNAGGVAHASGHLAVSSARVPLSAFLSSGSKNRAAPVLPPVAFDGVTIDAGRDVRVQSGEVDIGGQGSLALRGTLASPKLDGTLHATGGTIDFYHTFALHRASVTFDPDSGIVPYVDAVATTFVASPPTDVRLHVVGPATQMNLQLESEPVYDRQQIVGLLVGAQQFGAVQGVSSTASGGFSLPGAARNVALGQANTVFVRHLLEPLSASLGASLGFSDLQITSDLQSGLGLNAVKAFGKNVNAVFADSFGYPAMHSVALVANPSVGTSLRLRAFSSQGPTLMSLQEPQNVVGLDALQLNPMTALPATGGTSGVDFAFVRKFP